jgi:hypothetical protein
MWGVYCYAAAESRASADFICTVILLVMMMITTVMMATKFRYLCISCEIVPYITATQNSECLPVGIACNAKHYISHNLCSICMLGLWNVATLH